MIIARRLQQWKLTRSGPYPWVLALAVFALLFQSVQLIFAIVTPIGPIGDWRPPMATIIPVEERSGLLAAFDPYYRGDAPSAGPTQVTSLDLTLFGVTINRATGDGSAIIAGPDDVQNSYALGQEVAPGAVLAELGMDHVWIESGGQREILYIDQSIPAEDVAPADRAGASAGGSGGAATSGVSISPIALAEGLSIQPRRQGDRVTGLTVAPQGDGAIFRRLGLQPGDVIVSANGKPVRSAADLMSQARSGSNLSLRLERGPDTVSIGLNLE